MYSHVKLRQATMATNAPEIRGVPELGARLSESKPLLTAKRVMSRQGSSHHVGQVGPV